MEELKESKVVVITPVTTTTSNTINSKIVAAVISYMRRELLSEAKPEMIGKTQSTIANHKSSGSIFDGSIYVEPKGRSYYTTGEKLLSNHVSYFFERGNRCRQAGKELDKKVCVILGDPGSGKTTFGKHFMRQCFERWAKNPNQYPIPLWIPLSRLKLGRDRDRHQIYCDLLTYLFVDRMELSLGELEQLKKQPLHIFLDSYDEINYSDNLYDDNQWREWPQTQFVIATRPEKFRSQPHSLDHCLMLYFAPNPKSQEGLSVYTISSLDEESIKQFIAQWVTRPQHTQTNTWNKEKYWQAIEATPNIKMLAANPVMLTMLLYALPELDKEYSGKSDVERNRLEQLAIYDKFVSIWFAQQEKRIKEQLQEYPRLREVFRKTVREEDDFSITACLRAYTENLAYRCLLDSPNDKLSIEINKKNTLSPELLRSLAGAQRLLKKLAGKTTDQGEPHTILWLKLLRSGCLLRCDANYFSFFHKSLVEYFTQQHMFNDVCMAPEIIALEKAAYTVAKEQGIQAAQAAAMNGKLLVKEHNVISMLAKRVLSNTTLRDKLYDLVTYSCQEPGFSTAAANAITILKCAHQPLNHSERDWRGLRIPGADLSYAILEHVQWQGGDLHGVNFYGAYLKEANFKDANLLGCLWPKPDKLQGVTLLGMPTRTTAAVYTWDGKLFIIGDIRGKIVFYSTATYQQLKIVEQYSWYSVSFNYPVSALAVDGGLEHRHSNLLASAASPFNANLGFTTTWVQEEGVIYLWKLPSGKYLGKLTGHKSGIDDLQLSANGKKLVSHGTDGTIFIWDTQRLRLIQQIKGGNDYFSEINFELASSSLSWINEKIIYIVPEKEKGKKKNTRQCLCHFMGVYGHVKCIRIELSGKEIKMLKGAIDQANQLKEKIIKKIAYREYASSSVALSPSGKYIVFVNGDGQLQGFGATNVTPFLHQKTPQNIAEELTHVNHLRFSPDERYLAACGRNGKIVLWSIETNEPPAVLTITGKTLTQLAFSADGKHIAAVSSNKIEWINLRHSTMQTIDEIETDESVTIALSLDSSEMAITDNGIRLCSISSDALERKKVVAFLKDSELSYHGDYIISTIDGKIALFSATTGVLEQAMGIEGKVLGFSIDEKYFFFRKKCAIYQYSLKTGKQQCMRQEKCLENTTICSSNGRYAAKRRGHLIALYVLDEPSKDHLLSGHEFGFDVIGISFSANADWLVSWGSDGVICIWSTVTGKNTGYFNGHRGLMKLPTTNAFSLLNIFKVFALSVYLPSYAIFSQNGSLLASGSGGYTSYTIFVFTREGKQERQLVYSGGISMVAALVFSTNQQHLAVLVSSANKTQLHLWDWKKGYCIQKIQLNLNYFDFNSNYYTIVWQGNSIRILNERNHRYLTYYKSKNDTAYRLSHVIGTVSPNFKQLSLHGTRGLSSKQYYLLKAQGAQGKPKAFAHIVNDKKDAIEEKRELDILRRCRRGLTVQREQHYTYPALFEPQKHISSNRWHVILFRITECASQSTSNITSTTQGSTTKGAIDFHVYGFLEGPDAAGRSVMIQFDLVEDRYCPEYARIKHKCVITESQDLKSRQQAFMTMFNREKTLPNKLCIRIAGTLDTEQRDALLDTIIEEQQRQFDSQELWQERRIRYQKTGGIKTNLVSDYFSANCLTWLYHILQPYNLSLPHSIWDNVVVNPRHTLSESNFFRQTSSKIIVVSGWEVSETHKQTRSFQQRG